jgi:hypothetical protein
MYNSTGKKTLAVDTTVGREDTRERSTMSRLWKRYKRGFAEISDLRLNIF